MAHTSDGGRRTCTVKAVMSAATKEMVIQVVLSRSRQAGAP